MKRMGTILIAMIMLIGVLAVFPANAEMDSLAVMVSAPERYYEEEDIIEVEILVFDKGVPVDADFVNVTLDTRWQNPDLDINVTHEGTGVYHCTYEVADNDHHAWFDVDVIRGTDHEIAELDIDIVDEEFVLDVSFHNQNTAYVWSGETVTATITSHYLGDLVDVNQFDRIVLIDPEGVETELNETKVSTGIYDVEVSLPLNDTSGDYEIEVDATYAALHESASANIVMNSLAVWYRQDAMAGNTVTFTLGVADETGKSVEGASVVIEAPRSLTGTTDANGTVVFNMANVRNGIDVTGYVAYETKNQIFHGEIFTDDPYEIADPSNHEFDVVYQGIDGLYDFGQTINRAYKAYNATIPIQDSEIYYYVTSEPIDLTVVGEELAISYGSHTSALVVKGVATTNQLGEFNIAFTAPSTQGILTIWFEAATMENNPHNYDLDDDLVYAEDQDHIRVMGGELWSCTEVEVEAAPLEVGSLTQIRIGTPGLTGEDEVFAKIMPGTPQTGLYVDDIESAWVCWVEGGDRILLEKTGTDEYTGYANIPQFMDEDKYTIVAGYVDSNGIGHLDHVSLEEGEGAGALGGEDDDILMIVIILGLLIVIALLLLVMKKKKQAPQLGPESEPMMRPSPEIDESLPEEAVEKDSSLDDLFE